MFNVSLSESIVALVTPFEGASVDIKALRKLIRFQLDQGTRGIVAVGTTGEDPTLDQTEHEQVVELVVSEVAGQIPVIAGAGSNNTAHACRLHAHAKNSGAHAALHAVGYYNRPSQEGIHQHFVALDHTADLPILVYNIPPRSIVDIEPDTMARLAELENVIGVKDATRDLSRPLMERALINPPFAFLSGEDSTAVAYNAQGGQGCISVSANVAPALSQQMQHACSNGDYECALEIQRQLLPLQQALTIEPSPAGIKYACSLLGLCSANCRLPLVELTDNTKSRIRRAMAQLGLL